MATPRNASLVLGAGCWLAYLSFLAPIVTYGALRFAALYSADSLTAEPELSQQYQTFIGLSGVALAICLGIAAAAFGAWRRSVLQGILALALGSGTTIVALSVVPVIRFPEDQYPPAALWVMADGPALIVAFVLATVAGWVITTGKRLDTRATG
jgi:hypothetical protein